MINELIAKMLPYFPEKLVWIFGKPYISGQTINDALVESRKLNQNRIMVSVDLLGEYVNNLSDADHYKKQYIDLIKRFTAEKIDGHFSVKPSMFGLLLDKEACYRNLYEIVEVADQCNSFIRIDMEDSDCTSDEIAIFRRLKSDFPSRVGLVVQAYMRRTLDDVRNLLDLNLPETPLSFRLCKGIYIEKEPIAYQGYQEIRNHYIDDLRFMLQNGIYVGIATHDKFLVEKAYEIIDQLNIPKDKYEFQMLYGVAPILRQSIVDRGHHMRVYVPYGKQWFNYSTRRLKENPNMVWYILKAMFVRQ
ncbi:MAG: proline dehydrogenase family protein [Bacteroidia bacterium]|nr:proline dehydrogenase family protein [Bacteroidia bacterium]